KDFIKELNSLRGFTNCDKAPRNAVGCFRLPTEAEWEFAARGGSTAAYFFESGDLRDYAWYGANSNGQTHLVGSRLDNPYGLFDMYGNVWEWVEDKYSKHLTGGKNPLSVTGFGRVIRGGGWSGSARELRSASRSVRHWWDIYSHVGFRLVRTL
ncbi:MAG: formylglycine-generating enzyme family protein, partial [Halobacteriovoraceae bacterium]|nr:formylglycine-generating enzyme family protein [Halobacteriovoraceae bacterium]